MSHPMHLWKTKMVRGKCFAVGQSLNIRITIMISSNAIVAGIIVGATRSNESSRDTDGKEREDHFREYSMRFWAKS